MSLDRLNVFPNIENSLNTTLREWLYFHNVMHRHYTTYLGHKVLKPPFDWIVLGDILFDTRPGVVIEIGSFEGGTALWIAHYLDAMQSDTPVIGIDLHDRAARTIKHPRITWVVGDCLDGQVITRVEELCGRRRGFVIEDSDHKYHITKAILNAYERFVAVGSYFLVEDTIVEFLNLPPTPGPLRAVQEFVQEQGGTFVVDRSREKYILTYNPMGYLLRMA
jgi:cephalosporin hydroxylase